MLGFWIITCTEFHCFVFSLTALWWFENDHIDVGEFWEANFSGEKLLSQKARDINMGFRKCCPNAFQIVFIFIGKGDFTERKTEKDPPSTPRTAT